jgi:hypothetical protein
MLRCYSSPTYIAALPNHDKMAAKLKRLFPRKIAYRLIRYKISCTLLCLQSLQVLSEMKNFIINGAKGWETFLWIRIYSNYNPWEQRFVLHKR